MLWREIGGHYTHSFETNFGHIAIGGNLKYLSGIEALGIETTRTSELKRLSTDEISAETVNLIIMGTTTAIDLDDNFGKSAKGTGLGMDIGVSFVFEDYEDDYKLKLGLAINDIGSITFDEGVEGHVLESNNRTIFNKQDYLELTGIRDIVNRASNNILGNPSASLDPSISQIKMGLPTSLVLNADYKVMDQVYVGAVMVQRLPKTKIGLSSPKNVLRNPPVVIGACQKRFQSTSGPATSAYEKGNKRCIAASPGSSVSAEIPSRQGSSSVRKRILK